MICPDCGYEYSGAQSVCPLCSGNWDVWKLKFSPLPLEEIQKQVSAWLAQLPHPSAVEVSASVDGMRIFLLAPPGAVDGAVKAWGAMTRQQTLWEKVSDFEIVRDQSYHLGTTSRVPEMSTVETRGDPLLSLSNQMLGQAKISGRTISLRFYILDRDNQTQEKLRELAAYAYGTDSGVGSGGNIPNPWGLRLGLWRTAVAAGTVIAAGFGGAISAGWVNVFYGALGAFCGGLLFLVGMLGTFDWMQWRSIPKATLERHTQDTLLKVGISLHGLPNPDVLLLSGEQSWRPLPNIWPGVRSRAISLPASQLSGFISPPQMGEGAGVIARDARQDVPAPPPERPLLDAPFKVGWAASTGEDIGIDPDSHGLVVGGSRTGKSSFVYRMLLQLIERGDDAPGIFLVDPHLSLADAFLDAVDKLPPEARSKAIRRLRIISPDQPELMPLNLLAVPDFKWAGNTLVQVGQRIWGDYWGPRMQSAFLGLFRLAHAWNAHNPDQRLGLMHTVFTAINQQWRHEAFTYVSPHERIGGLALDMLLGQLDSATSSKAQQSWVTEVISPIVSKTMTFELAPWLNGSLHQSSFIDVNKWIDEKAWVIMRLPSGEIGREGARLTASVVFNVFDAAYRQKTKTKPVPFYFVIDEAQEIAAGMQLEDGLSQLAKFGGRFFVLAQSLSMLRRVPGFEAVVQSLLANTSTQAFFAPDPEDADLIRAGLGLTARYGNTTLDLKTLHCWLRARVNGEWQPPTQMRILPLARANPKRVEAVIREVIESHPDEYFSPNLWEDGVVKAMLPLVPPGQQYLLNDMLTRQDVKDKHTAGAGKSDAGKESNGKKKDRIGNLSVKPN